MMQWIHHYQLFLFDLDGLLVNTEQIHYQAYREALRFYGEHLDWEFSQYCLQAHYGAQKLKEAIYQEHPELSVSWEELYDKKQQIIETLLIKGQIHLMSGAAALLEALQHAKISSCVVTNSPRHFVEVIRKKNPLLNTISHWVTRSDYTHPKPHPECYQKAIAHFSKDQMVGRIVGFEDTPRGIQALLLTPALPVMVSNIPYPEMAEFVRIGVRHFPALDQIVGSQL